MRPAPESAVRRRPLGGVRKFLKLIGPGVVTGAADLDPTTVATVAVIGSTTVYTLSWLAWLVFPMMAIVLRVATRVGAATGRNLQQCVRDRYGPWPQWLLLLSLVSVNVLTIAADLRAGSTAVGLVVGRDSVWFLLFIAAAVVGLLCWGTYDRIVRVLKYVMLCLLAYVVAAVLAGPDWGTVLSDTFIPHLSADRDHVEGALAMLGTTLTGYVYVWQTVEAAEERPTGELLRRRQTEAVISPLFSVIIMWFILIATAATLGTRGQRVETAEQAAQALTPFAGRYAAAVFGVGLLASALVALPVLLATNGYVVAAQLRARRGLSQPVRRAPMFYGVLVGSTVLALGIVALGVSPVRLLFLASIVAGVVTPAGLVALMLIAGDRRIMGEQVVRGRLNAAGWVVTAAISLMSVLYLVNQLAGG